eukprot:TRINITY_DN3351_c0_g1_i1.p1 TRINITY_DN3351_c0_g1~~TRINITY_DN3351_c0_g1_i1.p1  ORF type:complete len:127 (+),score=19.62 TRINITY_DN3351_c0_g1_i1:45-425(+)
MNMDDHDLLDNNTRLDSFNVKADLNLSSLSDEELLFYRFAISSGGVRKNFYVQSYDVMKICMEKCNVKTSTARLYRKEKTCILRCVEDLTRLKGLFQIRLGLDNIPQLRQSFIQQDLQESRDAYRM